MATLEIDCPVCGEILEMSDEDRVTLEVGDIIVCDSCNAEMEVTLNNSDTEFDLALLEMLTTCPSCDEEFGLSEEMLQEAHESSVVSCPHCLAKVEIVSSEE